MDSCRHPEVMSAVALLIAFVAVCVLGAVFGTDSRFDRPGRQL
jgi:hypothetical protein